MAAGTSMLPALSWLFDAVLGGVGSVYGVWCDYRDARSGKERRLIVISAALLILWATAWMLTYPFLSRVTELASLTFGQAVFAWLGLGMGVFFGLLGILVSRINQLRLLSMGADAQSLYSVVVEPTWRISGGPATSRARAIVGAVLILAAIAAGVFLFAGPAYSLLKPATALIATDAAVIIALIIAGMWMWTSPKLTRHGRRAYAIWMLVMAAIIAAHLAARYLLPETWQAAEGKIYGVANLIWVIYGARRGRKLAKAGKMYAAGALPQFEPGAPMRLPRARALAELYGIFAGATAWMLAITVITADWIGFAVVLFGLAGVPPIALRVFAPRYRAMTLFEVAAAAVLNLAMVNLRWNAWMAAYAATRFYSPLNNMPLWMMNLLLAAIFAIFLCALRLKMGRTGAALYCAVLPMLFLPTLMSGSMPPSAQPTWKLPNGLRVMLVPIQGSEHVSIFTYLPMSLASDDEGKAMWSHLVEHMLVKTMHPDMTREINAETLPDHVRLDFYGTRKNWKQGLSYHAAWLKDEKFSQVTLDRDKPLVLRECNFVERNLASHKMAMAAWNQAVRYGAAHAAIRGDIERAELSAVQAYADRRMAMLPEALVCIVGGVNEGDVRKAAGETLSGIRSKGKVPRLAPVVPADRDITWDLSTRHLIVSYPIPGPADKEYAALYAAATALQMRFYNNAELKKSCGDIFASVYSFSPNETYFCINAALKSDAAFDAAKSAIAAHVSSMQEYPGLSEIVMTGSFLGNQLACIPDIGMLQSAGPRDMLEANVGIKLGMFEFQFGGQRMILANALATLTPETVRSAIQTRRKINSL
jgi:predicted Zn-dependent peptidase